MTTRVVAHSLSRSVQERLRQGRCTAQVLAAFERACDLLAPDGTVIALVTAPLGNGPFHIVVDTDRQRFPAVRPGMPAVLQADWIRLDGVEVDLRRARTWEPCPEWKALRARRSAIADALPHLQAFCIRHAGNSLLFPLLERVASSDLPGGHILPHARSAVEALYGGWRGELPSLRRGARALAGLGNGLTPAGDDFLLGLILYAWLFHPDPQPFCQDLATVAARRTTMLSAAFLRAAARGQCGAAWHRLFAGLDGGCEKDIVSAAQGILGYGATSGADSLVGFLYLFHQGGSLGQEMLDCSQRVPRLCHPDGGRS